MVDFAKDLQGKVAVVTGGGGVLCGAMAKELGKYGVKVVILNRTPEKGRKVADDIVAGGGTAEALACDVLDGDSIRQAAEYVQEKYGVCDILINGAGGGHPRGNTTLEHFEMSHADNPDIQTILDLTPDGFGHVFNLNFMGTWNVIQAFIPLMAERETSTTIINISSMAATRPATKVPAYSAAKAAIDNLTMWLAVHLVKANIRVNAIAPGFFLTEQNRNLLLNPDGSYTERSRKILAHTPMGRFGQPEDLLGTLLWLANERMSGFVTGVTVPVDGGFLAYSGV